MNFFLTYIKRIAILAIIYTTSRICFYLNNSDSFNSTRIIDFFEGLRFDVSALAYINIPLLILLLLPTNLRTKNSSIKIINILFYVVNIPFIILNNVDIEYFRFTQKRSTADFFQLMQLGEDAKNIIPQYIKDYWMISVFTFIQVWYLLKVRYIPKTKFSLKIQGASKSILIFIIGSAFCVIAARGGVQLKPINPINAGELSGSPNSALILNTPFCILHSLDEKPLNKYNYFEIKDLKNIYSPIHFSTNKKMNKKNIVIFILESFSREFVGFYNNGIGYTPFLDSLAQKSLVFTNAYANGLKSIEALPAITASIPTLMDNPFITSSYAQNDFKSMAYILNAESYNTSFYHGGIRGTMGFHSFCKKAGFKNYFGIEEYNNNSDFDETWGIYDKPFMQFFTNGLDNEEEPFFSTFFSLSSHPPYTLPNNYLKELNKKDKSKRIGIRETISYTDHAIKNFFKQSRTKKWFENTIFIITADHTSPINYNPKYKNRIGRYAIPLIIFSGDSSLQGENHNIVQQIDIMPTVLEMLRYNKTFFGFGKSMLSGESWAISFLQNEYRLITNNSIIINKKEHYNSFSDWNLSKSNKQKSYNKKLLQGIKQDYNNRMLNNNLY